MNMHRSICHESQGAVLSDEQQHSGRNAMRVVSRKITRPIHINFTPERKAEHSNIPSG